MEESRAHHPVQTLPEHRTMHSLTHLVYSSTATVALTQADIVAVLRASRRNNARVGVTGILLYTAGSFFQILEGHPAQVEATFERILTDPRHNRVVTLIRERIPRRTFGEWSMGYATPTSAEIAAEVGVNDFFGHASCFEGLDHGRAKKLLQAFRQGRWRSHGNVASTQERVALSA
ncbi:MAG: BLUF domain-containing protein [bacterium]